MVVLVPLDLFDVPTPTMSLIDMCLEEVLPELVLMDVFLRRGCLADCGRIALINICKDN